MRRVSRVCKVLAHNWLILWWENETSMVGWDDQKGGVRENKRQDEGFPESGWHIYSWYERSRDKVDGQEISFGLDQDCLWYRTYRSAEPSVDIVYMACFLVGNDSASIPAFALKGLAEGFYNNFFEQRHFSGGWTDVKEHAIGFPNAVDCPGSFLLDSSFVRLSVPQLELYRNESIEDTKRGRSL